MDKNTPFQDMDNAKLNKGHLKIWFISGMGFFTDAYDLFIIGIVLVLLTGHYSTAFHLNTVQSALIGSSALISAIIGQLFFGRIADLIGRKKIYGIEASILAIAAIGSAFSANFITLFIWRFILGIGIGGDYPLSATIMSEYSNSKDRGKLIGFVFANQGFGSVIAVFVGILSVIYFPADIAWRLMLAIGALPALMVIYFRRKLPETPRYSMFVKKDIKTVNKAKEIVGVQSAQNQLVETKISKFSIFLKNYWKTLLVTSSTWFLLDIAFYGTGIYSASITGSIIQSSTLTSKILIAGIPYFIGFFGYFTAVALLDKIGRKVIQIQGFLMMGILYLIVSFLIIPGKTISFMISKDIVFIIYAMTFFFIDFGPNETTFILPSELFPVKYRTTGHGISAASGKLGAAISTFFMPILLLSLGVKEVLFILAILAFLGGIISFLIKEPAGKTLEEASSEIIQVNPEIN